MRKQSQRLRHIFRIKLRVLVHRTVNYKTFWVLVYSGHMENSSVPYNTGVTVMTQDLNISDTTIDPTKEFRAHFLVTILPRYIILVHSIITIVGVSGNSLVIYVITTRKHMQSVYTIMLLGLAVSDLVFVTICVPMTAYNACYNWQLGDAICKITQWLIHGSLAITICTLSFIALVRFLAVFFPLKSRVYLTKRNIALSLLLIWLLCLSLAIVYADVFAVKSYDYGGQNFTGCLFEVEWYGDVMNVTCFASFLLISILSLCSYLKIIHDRATFPGGEERTSQGDRRGPHRTDQGTGDMARAMTVVILAFFVCYLPFNLLNMLKLEWLQTMIFLQIARFMVYTNSCINPILYAFSSKKFKEEFRRACCCLNRTSEITSNPSTLRMVP